MNSRTLKAKTEYFRVDVNCSCINIMHYTRDLLNNQQKISYLIWACPRFKFCWSMHLWAILQGCIQRICTLRVPWRTTFTKVKHNYERPIGKLPFMHHHNGKWRRKESIGKEVFQSEVINFAGIKGSGRLHRGSILRHIYALTLKVLKHLPGLVSNVRWDGQYTCLKYQPYIYFAFSYLAFYVANYFENI